MKPIYLKLIFDRTKRASSTKEGAVEVRLTQDRRSLYYTTGIRLLPRHWHHGQIVNRVDAAEIQETIDNLIRRIRRTINEMMAEGSVTLDYLMDKLRERDIREINFFEFCEQRIIIRTYKKTAACKERYERFLRYLLAFGKVETFADITDENILAFDKYLADKGMKNYSKWQNYHRCFNSFILDAIDAGYLRRNPYRWLPIEKEKSYSGIGKYLTMDEFFSLKNLEPPTDCLRHVRDLFVFQTYTCLSYVDMAAFDAKQIKYVNGKPIYTANRGKTKQEFKFLVLPPAMDILKRYNYRLPIMTNEKYNVYLKVLALMSGIDKPISSHWARHTGATMLLNSGHLDMEIVSKVLGHSSTKRTRQIYAKLLDNTVVEAMSKIDLNPPKRKQISKKGNKVRKKKNKSVKNTPLL